MPCHLTQAMTLRKLVIKIRKNLTEICRQTHRFAKDPCKFLCGRAKASDFCPLTDGVMPGRYMHAIQVPGQS